MSHIFLLIVCILSVEILIKSKLLSIIDLLLKVFKKLAYVVTSKNISDHWKEKAVLEYALVIMKYSVQILIIFLSILSFFLIIDFFYNDLYILILSLTGLIESLVFSLGYFYLRKSILK